MVKPKKTKKVKRKRKRDDSLEKLLEEQMKQIELVNHYKQALKVVKLTKINNQKIKIEG